MVWVSAFFVGWVLLMALRGYVRGLWVSLFDLFGLVAAYGICILYGQKVVLLLQSEGLSLYLAYLIGYPVLFFVVNSVLSLLARAIFNKFIGEKPLLTWQGASLGGVSGLFSGLVLLWCFNFINGVFFSQENHDTSLAQAPPRGENSSAFLVSTANNLMATAVKVGAKASGASVQQSSVAAAMAAEPAAFMGDFRSTLQSEELKQFYANPQVQYLMATENHQALAEHDLFLELMSHPGVQRLRETLLENNTEQSNQAGDSSAANARAVNHYLATQVSNLWRRVEALKNDSEVQTLLQDKQVQQMMAEKDLVKLMSNSKIQSVLAKLFGQGTIQAPDFTAFIEAYESTQGFSNTQGDIYRWVNEQGEIQYSKKSAIPRDRASTAVLVEQAR